MIRNAGRWVGEEAAAFGIPLVSLSAYDAQHGAAGVCDHVDLGGWGGGHWDCGDAFPMDRVLDIARGSPPDVLPPPVLQPEVADMLIMFRVLEHADPKPTYLTNGFVYRQLWGSDPGDVAWNMAQCGMPDSAQEIKTYGIQSCGFAGQPMPDTDTTPIREAPVR
jgi:hypothetical protein